MYYITPDGSYYEGTFVAEGSVAVPQRPSAEHIWQDGWVVDFATQKAAELLDFRTKREQYLNRVAGIGFAAKEAGDAVTVAAAVSVRNGLLDLPAHPSVTAATDIVTLKLAIRTRYAEIVGAVPAAAKAAFKKVDQ